MNTELSDDVLSFVAEVEARTNAATPGPWLRPLADEPRAIVSADNPGHSLLGIDVDGMAVFECERDAVFATKARSDVPALCRLVRSRQELLESVLQYSINQGARLSKLEVAARFAYDAVLESSCCDEPCDCIDCQILETLGEALNIPRIGET